MDNQAVLNSLLHTTSQQLLQLVNPISESGDIEKAMAIYKAWLRIHADAHYIYPVYFNLGVLLAGNQNLQGALQAYKNAVAIKPDFLQARMNLGGIYEKLNLIEDALSQWRLILEITGAFSQIAPDLKQEYGLLANNALGRVLDAERRYAEAEVYLTHSLEIDASQDDVLNHWVGVRQRQCKWPVFAALPQIPLSRKKWHLARCCSWR